MSSKEGTYHEAEVPFYCIDFVLEAPRAEGETESDTRIETMQFRYADIYKEGLEERVEKANEEAIAYNTEQDAKKSDQN